ncbi:MAG: undecaprenyldiphospho-muramoylpentapeptide beta-N-acetylglucosaminyltransferase [Acidobacteria bacterium]|nr:undecaprenyldiphospho-muramoylpentapeptide beta-N-acetylglucosaminyltransferase [Acidobacteriota bacterium]
MNDERKDIEEDEFAEGSVSPRPSVSPSLPLSVIIAGGGTGGHIFPGVAIAQEFKRRNPETQILFVGTARGLETKIIPREGFKLHLIEVAALKRVSLLKRIKSLLMLPKSFLAVRSLIQQFKPDVVIGVGGYSSGPVVLMAALMDVPTVVAESNALPGFTNRILARFVRAAAVTFEEARRYFGEKAEITGNPVRAEFFAVQPKAQDERTHIFITGGSQGARAINLAMIDALPLLAEEKERLSITHQTGESDYDKVRAAYLELGWRVEVRPFVEKMVEEFAKADLVITRAGATTVAELAAAGKPALMIPFPFAADDHQRKNAEAVERAGAGRMILQAELTPERLAQELLWLIRDPQQLVRMAEASKKLGHPNAASKVVELAMKVMGSESSLQAADTLKREL